MNDYFGMGVAQQMPACGLTIDRVRLPSNHSHRGRVLHAPGDCRSHAEATRTREGSTPGSRSKASAIPPRAPLAFRIRRPSSEIVEKNLVRSTADLDAVVHPHSLSPIPVAARLRGHQMKQGVSVAALAGGHTGLEHLLIKQRGSVVPSGLAERHSLAPTRCYWSSFLLRRENGNPLYEAPR